MPPDFREAFLINKYFLSILLLIIFLFDMNDILFTNIQYLQGVGPKRSKIFNSVGIFTIFDLINFLPIRYLDRSIIVNTKTIIQTSISNSDQPTIIGKLIYKEIKNISNNRQLLKCQFKDEFGNFTVLFFNGIKYFSRILVENNYYIISGKPTFSFDDIEFVHPEIEEYTAGEMNSLNTGKIIPIFSQPEIFKKSYINQAYLRKIILNAIHKYKHYLIDFLPKEIKNNFHFVDLATAYENIHYPTDFKLLEAAKKRLKFNEIFFFLLLMKIKKNYYHSLLTHQIILNEKLVEEFLSKLPFKLTTGQLSALDDIKKDLTSNKSMNRLLQGDVGSGKTLVSLIAILYTINEHNQAAFLVPTEILANQHYKKITQFLQDFNIRIELLIGSTPKKKKLKILEELKNGEIQILIGTHALLEENVEFNHLAICIIDEQHRFGVEQRAKLIQKGKNPHTLFMSATPIPRTLAMTIYSDLDLSIIQTMPANRKPIKTYLRSHDNLDKIYSFASDKIQNDNYQVYIVAPLVEESDKLELKSANLLHQELQQTILNKFRIGLIHGKMKWYEKDEIMQKFANKELDILVSTTVIEVGIDVPDANIIIIMDAHRFGLSQLHQLRGRVGRSDKEAYCVLVTTNDIYSKANITNPTNYIIDPQNFNFSQDEITVKRLEAMVSTTNGFLLSELDLKMRGPGNLLGTQQTGLPEFKLFDLSNDSYLINTANQIIQNMLENSPNLEKYPLVKKILFSSFKDEMKYLSIG